MIQLNSNASALNAQHHLQFITSDVSKSIERLSTGYRINHAGDDAAGLQISVKLESRLRANRQAQENIQSGLNVITLAEGVIDSLQEITHRAKELVLFAAGDTLNAEQRDTIQKELNQLTAEINRLATVENPYGDSRLFNGTDINIQIHDNETINLNSITDPTPGAPGITGHAFGIVISNFLRIPFMDVSTQSLAQSSLNFFSDSTLNPQSVINARRAKYAAMSAKLENASKNLDVEYENLIQAQSHIRDTNIAEESATLTRNQVRQNAATSMLAQASRQNAQVALSLLQ